MGILAGKRVVNTRAVHQAGELDALLAAFGAMSLSYPCLAILPPVDAAPLDTALADLASGAFDWLVVTSANTVHALSQRGLHDSRCHAQVAAIGPATAHAVRRLGLTVSFVPERFDGPSLGEAVPIRPGQRVFLPASEIAHPDLSRLLTKRGAIVTMVSAYRTTAGEGGIDLPRLLAGDQVDAITLASSSAVDGLITRLSAAGVELASLAAIPLVCLGARTRDRALERGLAAANAAEQSTLSGLIETLERVFSTAKEEGSSWSRAS